MSKPSICFVSLQAYPLLGNSDCKTVGGAELQQVLLAKELASRGFEISFVVGDYGQKKLEEVNGIIIIKSSQSFISHRNRVLRSVPDALSLQRAMNIANADIYYQRTAHFYTGQVAFFCKIKRKKFIFSIGHDSNCDINLLNKLNKAIKFMYVYGIKNADCIVAQSKEQQSLMKENFGKDSVLIKTGHFLPEHRPDKNTPPTILWVGALSKGKKQPELFLKLAKSIPDAKFQMICAPSIDKRYYQQINELADRIPNLDIVGFVPYPEVNQYFERASIFVNTSSVEGFPNTFIQAWARYTPVVSLNVDPDEIICKYKLGLHSRTFKQMVEDVKLLLEDEELREEMGVNGRKYVEREHDLKKIVEKYIKLFKTMMGGNG